MPWVVEPSVMDLMCSIVERWAVGDKLSAEEIAAAIGENPAAIAARAQDTAAQSGDGVAVVPVYGVLAHRAYSVQNTSRPLTSTEALAGRFRAAAADPSIGTVIADMDSPGGSVFGVQELAAVLGEVRAAGKKLVAVANNTAASGAYWLASQADEIVVTPSGMVGSIGVIVPHTDMSVAYERAGVRRQFITYGKFKAEGNDAQPLTEDARANLQSIVDEYGGAFTRAVARGRGVPVETVRGPAFGEGRMKTAADAKASGMVDSIDTLDNVISRYRRGAKTARRGMSASLADRDIQIAEA